MRLHVEIATASLIWRSPHSAVSTRAPARSLSATRSRSSTAATRWEIPTRTSSLTTRLAFVVQPLRQLGQLVDLALDAAELAGHDRDVEQDQREEDDVGRGDVGAGGVERQRGHQRAPPGLVVTLGAALRRGGASDSSPASSRRSRRSCAVACLEAIS